MQGSRRDADPRQVETTSLYWLPENDVRQQAECALAQYQQPGLPTSPRRSRRTRHTSQLWDLSAPWRTHQRVTIHNIERIAEVKQYLDVPGKTFTPAPTSPPVRRTETPEKTVEDGGITARTSDPPSSAVAAFGLVTSRYWGRRGRRHPQSNVQTFAKPMPNTRSHTSRRLGSRSSWRRSWRPARRKLNYPCRVCKSNGSWKRVFADIQMASFLVFGKGQEFICHCCKTSHFHPPCDEL